MPQASARISEEKEEQITAFSDENGLSKSEAIRTLLKRGLEYEELQTENERLNNSLRRLVDQRKEHSKLVEYVEEEQSLQQHREERRAAPVWQRAKWWLFGQK